MGIKTYMTEMFGIKYPIISAAMGPLFTKELALAVSEAGGLGVVGEHSGGSNVKFMKESIKFVVDLTYAHREMN
ncbi:MAG: nitronate monooxygenase [Promethearchaeota archaeon]